MNREHPCRYLHTVGKVHIYRSDCAPRIGSFLRDGSGRKVAKVLDVFGPVGKPYIVAEGDKAEECFPECENE